MKRKQINNKEVKKIIKTLTEKFKIEGLISKKDRLELVEDYIITCNHKPIFFYYQEILIPTLKLLIEDNFLPKVVIDMPAVKFIINGADVMRPGIKEMELFEKNQPIVIIDETHKKPLAIGIPTLSSEDLEKKEKGKLIKNIHHVGDEIWSFN
ncbi:DUF1947 domain-containing protein [Candidatus Woesearchaeota archaeon]|jgi:PUA-domain protein|nr:DUF1947 domain-containing protein [Candidatus Woesearchaeota archaeon]